MPRTIVIVRNRESGATAAQEKREPELKQLLKNQGKFRVIIGYHYILPQGRTSQQPVLPQKYLVSEKVFVSSHPNETHTQT